MKQAGHVRAATALVLSFSIGLFACGGESEEQSGGGSSASAGESAAAAEGEGQAAGETEATGEAAGEAAGPAGPLVNDPTFELRASASGPYSSGQPGQFEIRLTPRGGYHVNQEFPTTVNLAGPEAIAFPDSELEGSDAAEMTEQRARFAVAFSPNAAGQHRVTARVSFAVCTPENCMPDERTLALVLPVQ